VRLYISSMFINNQNCFFLLFAVWTSPPVFDYRLRQNLAVSEILLAVDFLSTSGLTPWTHVFSELIHVCF